MSYYKNHKRKAAKILRNLAKHIRESNFDYEILENESKRNIILIEDVYAQQILEESRTLYG